MCRFGIVPYERPYNRRCQARSIRDTSGLSDAFDFKLPGKIALDDGEKRQVGGKKALQLVDDLQNDHGEQAVGLSLHVWQVAEVQVGGGLSVFISKEVEGLHLLLRHRLDGAA